MWETHKIISPFIKVNEDGTVALLYSREKKDLLHIDEKGNVSKRAQIDFIPKNIIYKDGKIIGLIKDTGKKVILEK